MRKTGGKIIREGGTREGKLRERQKDIMEKEREGVGRVIGNPGELQR